MPLVYMISAGYHDASVTVRCLNGLLQKHNARAAVVLQPQLLPQSFLLADLVGMTIAGLAMCLAVGAIYVATRFSTNQLSGAYVTIIVVGYMLKDRVKEWGKRYLQPAAMKFGFEFPDRTVKVGSAQASVYKNARTASMFSVCFQLRLPHVSFCPTAVQCRACVELADGCNGAHCMTYVACASCHSGHSFCVCLGHLAVYAVAFVPQP